MKTGLKFVTAAALISFSLILNSILACDGHRITREEAGAEQHAKKQDEIKSKIALQKEGNEKLTAATAIQQELNEKFKLPLTPAKLSEGLWSKMSKDERRQIQGKLAQFMQLVNRALEIDSTKLMMIENRDQLLLWRDAAEAAQKSVEKFERNFGENIDPKPNTTPEPPKQGTNAE